MKEKEGKHYKKKVEKTSDTYSLRSLVTEISGIPEDHNEFHAKEKRIRRILQSMQAAEHVENGTPKIHKDKKAAVVKAIRDIDNNAELEKIVKKFSFSEGLTREELLYWADFQREWFKAEQPEDVQKQIDEQYEMMTETKYFEKLQLILDLIWKDTEMIGEINNMETKLKYMDEYKSILEIALIELRFSIISYLIQQDALKSVIEKNPHFQEIDQITDAKIAAEMQEKIQEEINKKLAELD
ncbi:Uncharacterised protein [Acetobacterium wieringae]|uniref:hypothetical protein n=1 Tax=Acetobacterium wieringae TaxID=52694 RepID=UPI001D9D9882|nr:hypothetical protein [Acetobacterium wieringae]VUZ23647.1 Uncharacterised protein [Acetobacterium wieringae]